MPKYVFCKSGLHLVAILLLPLLDLNRPSSNNTSMPIQSSTKVKDTAKNMRATLIKDMGFAVARNINPISARRLKHYLVSLLDSLVVPRGEKPSLAATFEAGEGDLRMMQNRWFAVPKQTREYLVHNLTAIRECNYSYSKLLPASFEGF